ncbi:MAG: hypothetical protein LBI69_01430 [Puniceicoccales bacterium]|nr:hypothetical protein [Puniceicoccales bacterium]
MAASAAGGAGLGALLCFLYFIVGDNDQNNDENFENPAPVELLHDSDLNPSKQPEQKIDQVSLTDSSKSEEEFLKSIKISEADTTPQKLIQSDHSNLENELASSPVTSDNPSQSSHLKSNKSEKQLQSKTNTLNPESIEINKQQVANLKKIANEEKYQLEQLFKNIKNRHNEYIDYSYNILYIKKDSEKINDGLHNVELNMENALSAINADNINDLNKCINDIKNIVIQIGELSSAIETCISHIVTELPNVIDGNIKNLNALINNKNQTITETFRKSINNYLENAEAALARIKGKKEPLQKSEIVELCNLNKEVKRYICDYGEHADIMGNIDIISHKIRFDDDMHNAFVEYTTSIIEEAENGKLKTKDEVTLRIENIAIAANAFNGKDKYECDLKTFKSAHADSNMATAIEALRKQIEAIIVIEMDNGKISFRDTNEIFPKLNIISLKTEKLLVINGISSEKENLVKSITSAIQPISTSFISRLTLSKSLSNEIKSLVEKTLAEEIREIINYSDEQDQLPDSCIFSKNSAPQKTPSAKFSDAITERWNFIKTANDQMSEIKNAVSKINKGKKKIFSSSRNKFSEDIFKVCFKWGNETWTEFIKITMQKLNEFKLSLSS